MKQYVDKPTRIIKDNQTLIDLIFANIKINCDVYDVPKIADHVWLSVELNRGNVNDKYRVFVGRDYSKFQIDEFLCAVEEGLELRQDLEVNERAGKFVQNMVAALDIVAPKKKFRIPKIWEGKKWYSEDIRLASSVRDEAYARAVYTANE